MSKHLHNLEGFLALRLKRGFSTFLPKLRSSSFVITFAQKVSHLTLKNLSKRPMLIPSLLSSMSLSVDLDFTCFCPPPRFAKEEEKVSHYYK